MVKTIKVFSFLTLLVGISCKTTKEDHKPKAIAFPTAKHIKASINKDDIDIPNNSTEIAVSHPYKGLKNFRELTPSINPKLILRKGQLFRSDAFHKLDSNAQKSIVNLGIKSIIDLRSLEEIEEFPNKQIGSVLNVFNTPIGTDPAKLKSLGISPKVAANIKTYFLNHQFNRVDSILEAHHIDLEKLREERYEEFAVQFNTSVSSFFKILVDSTNYPIAFHCQGGKDRTGFLSAVLGKILGFSEEDIVRDYLTTNIYTIENLEKQYKHGPKSLRPAYGAHTSQIKAALDKINTEYGSFQEYIKNVLHLSEQDINAIKQNVLKSSFKAKNTNSVNHNALRFIELEGANNFRDIGGLKTNDGHTVKKGLIYRSAKLTELTDSDLSKFKTLGLNQIIDLRSDSELKKYPDRLPENTQFIHRQIGKEGVDLDAFNEKFLSGHWSGESFRAFMIDGNIKMIEEGPYYFPQILNDLANNESGASVYHCAGGKDRTGVLTALILYMLDVPRESIINEYLTTNIQSEEIYKEKEVKLKKYTNNSLDPEIYQAKKAHRIYIETALNTIDHTYNGIDSYLKDYLKIDPKTIEKLKKKLIL